jgi:hypothetical protein
MARLHCGHAARDDLLMHGNHAGPDRYSGRNDGKSERALTLRSRIFDRSVMKFFGENAPFVDKLCCCERDHRSNRSLLRSRACFDAQALHSTARLERVCA